MIISDIANFLFCFGFAITTLCNGGSLPKPTLQDYFAGDSLELSCPHTSHYREGIEVTWTFLRFGRKESRKQYKPNEPSDDRVDVDHSEQASVLHIYPLLAKDSGRFDCEKATGSCSWKIDVHDPKEMVYVITSRGQKPWDDTVIGKYRVMSEWSEWTVCDGCAGNGERRKFGFCYVVWPNEKAHCSDITAFPVLVRGVTRNKREEIVVDVCYDQCQEYEEPTVVEEQRVDVGNGADASLICHEDSKIDSAIRWERDGEVLKRSDVSFGYAKTQPIYISKRNDLLLHNIDLPQGGVIKISCVEDRERRIRFDLYVQAHPEFDQVTFQDHLFWMLISSTVQIVAFLLILAAHITIENFIEAFSSESKQNKEVDSDEENNEEETDDF